MGSFWHSAFFVGEILGFLFIPVVLARKRPPVSAIAWSLTVVFIPYFGIFFFLVFGASRVRRRLRRKLYHRSRFLRLWTTSSYEKTGVGGKRLVAFANTKLDHVDEAKLQELMAKKQ